MSNIATLAYTAAASVVVAVVIWYAVGGEPTAVAVSPAPASAVRTAPIALDDWADVG